MSRAWRKPVLLLALLCAGLSTYWAARLAIQPGLAEGVQHHYLPIMQRGILPNWIGPDGGSIVCLAYDPLNPQTVYAGTWGAGVFKSSDGGRNWQPASQGLGNLYIQSLAVDPQQPTTLYAGTYKSQLYKSVDGGATWFLSSEGIQAEAVVYTIAIDPSNPQTLYIGTRGVSNNGNYPWSGVLYKSYDGGATWWSKLDDIGNRTDLIFQDWVYSIAVSPISPNLVFAAAHERGAFRSTDYGETWAEVNNGISDESGRAIVIQTDPTHTIVYMGVWHASGVFKTTNGGEEWLLSSSGISGIKISGMAHDNLQPGTLYVAGGVLGVAKSTNSGATWSVKGLTETLVFTIAVNPQQSSSLLAGTAGAGLYRSDDGGSAWANSQVGLRNAWVNALVIDAADSNRLYAAQYGGGVSRSTDGGGTWLPMNTGLSDHFLQGLLAHPAQPDILFALTREAGLFRCNLISGPCWELITNGLPTLAEYASLLPDNFDTPEAAWFMPDQPNTPSALLSMVFSHSDPANAYLGTGGQGVYRSTDGGLHWQKTGMLIQTVAALAAHPTDPLTVYAAIRDEGIADVWATSDSGDTWGRLNLPGGYAYSLVIDPQQPNLLYAGTGNGLYRFDGSNWAWLGLAGESVSALALHPQHSNQLYAGTSSGAYLSYDAGRTWQPGPAELNGLAIQTITFDPVDPSMVYFATTTRGILRAHLK